MYVHIYIYIYGLLAHSVPDGAPRQFTILITCHVVSLRSFDDNDDNNNDNDDNTNNDNNKTNHDNSKTNNDDTNHNQ